ncbi:MFS transporter [Chromobacterium phragmitis]|uniref:MFS transporter n=1 Tax=Chromobacterium phragmitis TaxID=2202141 RepID=UPI000DECE6D5|nr:MFS transporter [Chromobacterium phragmitis]AXE30141.1 MFS transporter [Chromobacterium phragmitis]
MPHARIKTPLFQPLRHSRFRDLCLANFISNIGAWMRIFATGWLLAKQSQDPSAAVLAQTANQAPIFLFALFGGVFADRMDQDRYLMLVNLQMLVAAALLAVAALGDAPSATVIISLTFALGAGAAFKVSAWQASMSSLVQPDEIEAAATLNGLSYNLASIIGPILGGWLFSLTGPAALYLANALSFVGLIVLHWRVLGGDKSSVPSAGASQGSFLDSLVDGVRHSFASPVFRRILGQTLCLFFAISIFQSLLPIYVKNMLVGSEAALGWLMAAFGAGAVSSAFALPQLRYLLKRAHLLGLATAVYGAMLLYFGWAPWLYSLLPAAFVAGFSWAGMVSTMNSRAQAVFPPAMRARALAVYSLVFSGALTVGGLAWGWIATIFGIGFAFKAAGMAMLAISAYGWLRQPAAKEGLQSATAEADN